MKNKILFAFVLSGLFLAGACKQEPVTQDAQQTGIKSIENSENTLTNTPAAGSQDVKPEPPADGKYPAMTFEENEFDFGTIKDGDKVEHVFKFKNTGEADLLIRNAVGSCGCTVPEYPKSPVKPGETAEMKVSFNSAGKHGKQAKTVTITTNTASGTEKLTVKAFIEAKNNTNKQS